MEKIKRGWVMEYASPLHEFIEKWMAEGGTTGGWVRAQAGLSPSTGTDIRQGAIPQPRNLRRLAEAIGVPNRNLLELAGHVDAEEQEPTELTGEQEAIVGLWERVPAEGKALVRQMLEAAANYVPETTPPPEAAG